MDSRFRFNVSIDNNKYQQLPIDLISVSITTSIKKLPIDPMLVSITTSIKKLPIDPMLVSILDVSTSYPSIQC